MDRFSFSEEDLRAQLVSKHTYIIQRSKLWLFLGISLDTEDSEYNAYLFYQLLEEQTSNAYTLVEDVKAGSSRKSASTFQLQGVLYLLGRFFSHQD